MDTCVGRDPGDFVKRFSDEIKAVMELANQQAEGDSIDKAVESETKKDK